MWVTCQAHDTIPNPAARFLLWATCWSGMTWVDPRAANTGPHATAGEVRKRCQGARVQHGGAWILTARDAGQTRAGTTGMVAKGDPA